MKKAVFLGNSADRIAEVYGQGRRQRLEGLVEMYPTVVGEKTWGKHQEALQEAEVVFSTWGMPALDAAQLADMPRLAAVFYAAGSVRSFARPLLERGIVVVSGWGANAVPVAEFTVAQTLLACKGYWRNTADCRSPQTRQGSPFRGRGAFGAAVGLIGMGMVGREVARRLQGFELEVLAHDPYMSQDDAAALGVEPVGLEELCRRSYVLSNHLPNLPATAGLVDGRLLAQLPRDATFINTGRGAQVVEADLIAVWRRRPDLTALLDVTFPEPPAADSPLYDLPNVHLTSHIAGSLNDEVVRMADYVIEEFVVWQQGQDLRYAVDAAMLERMA